MYKSGISLTFTDREINIEYKHLIDDENYHDTPHIKNIFTCADI